MVSLEIKTNERLFMVELLDQLFRLVNNVSIETIEQATN